MKNSSGETRSVVFPVRLTPAERKEIKGHCRKIGMSVSAYIRYATLHAVRSYRDTFPDAKGPPP